MSLKPAPLLAALILVAFHSQTPAVEVTGESRPNLVSYVFEDGADACGSAAGGDCDSFGCDTCGTVPCCCRDACKNPKWKFFGDFLYIRPGDDKVSYAMPINGAIAPPAGVAPVQIGTEGVVDNTFEPGFRVGFSRCVSDYGSLGATYTHFDSTTSDAISSDAPFVIRSLVHHPGTASAATDFLQASATSGVDFRLADIEFTRTLGCNEQFALRYVIGARYGHIQQDFDSVFSNSTTTEMVSTDIQFDGGGIRFGLSGERRAVNSGFKLYARGDASFLGGQFRGRYSQDNSFSGNTVSTGWKEDGIVSILEAEIGMGWVSCNDRWQFSAGYLISTWGDMVTTDEFIQAVQNANSISVNDSLTFDGLVVRAEMRF